MLNWLNSLFAGPKPAGPPQLLRAFASDQPTITQTGIRVENGACTLTLAPRSRRYNSLRWKTPPWSSVF
jgi:hypothetical protein